MKTRTINKLFLLFVIGSFIQCKMKNDTTHDKAIVSTTEITSQDTVLEKKQKVLTKVLTKEKGEHADDIVVLTPEFIKAIQGYEEIGVFSEGLAAVKKDGKWGYINTKGEIAIPITIDTDYGVGRFSEGLAYVTADDAHSFSLIDTEGKIVFRSDEGDGVSIEGDHIENPQLPYYINGKMYVYVRLSNEDEYGHYIVFDNCGNKVDTISMDKAEKLIQKELGKNNYISIREEVDDWHVNVTVKDSKGKIVIPAKYEYVQESYYYSDGYIKCTNGVFLVGYYENDESSDPAYWGYVDLQGNDTFSDDIKKRYGRKMK